MSKNASFKIVHLSDPHLTPNDDDERSEPRIFGRLTGMNETFRRVLSKPAILQADHVLVTGDIADRGDLQSWRVFWAAVDSAGLMNRISVLPGNHDVCCLDAVRLPQKGLGESDMKKAVAGLSLGRQPVKFPWTVQPDPRIIIFGLNSNNLGNLSAASNAMGEVGYYQLKSLASKLHKYRDVPIKIVALHHSPNIPEEATAKSRNQPVFGRIARLTHEISEDDRHSIILLCVAHRVRLLVHGHLHFKEDRRITGVRIVGAPAITEPLDKRTTRRTLQFWTYTISGMPPRVSVRLSSVNVQSKR